MQQVIPQIHGDSSILLHQYWLTSSNFHFFSSLNICCYSVQFFCSCSTGYPFCFLVNAIFLIINFIIEDVKGSSTLFCGWNFNIWGLQVPYFCKPFRAILIKVVHPEIFFLVENNSFLIFISLKDKSFPYILCSLFAFKKFHQNLIQVIAYLRWGQKILVSMISWYCICGN